MPPSASINLLPAQTAEKQIRNGGETQTQRNLAAEVSVRHFNTAGVH